MKCDNCIHGDVCHAVAECVVYSPDFTCGEYEPERPIKCKDCKYQIKEFRADKRMKDGGYWVYGCEFFGDLIGYWAWGGEDNQYCSEAELRGDENDK